MKAAMDDPSISPLEQRIAEWLRPQSVGIQADTGLAFALGTAVGRVRRENEDRVLYGRLVQPHDGVTLQFGVLCDGMGGMLDGGRCAELAISAFATSLVSPTVKALSLEQRLRGAVLRANERVYAFAQGRGGTTLSAVTFTNGRINCCHVGDSRIYVGNQGGFLKLSDDDTIAAQLDLIHGARHAMLPGHERLVQHVGMGEDLAPHLYTVDSAELLAVVLMSDGAYKPCAAMLPELFRHAPDPLVLSERLVKLSEWLGGRDNASVIVIDVARAQRHVKQQPRAILDLWGPALRVQILGFADPALLGAKEREQSAELLPSRARGRAKRLRSHGRAKIEKRDDRSAGPKESDHFAVEVGSPEDIAHAEQPDVGDNEQQAQSRVAGPAEPVSESTPHETQAEQADEGREGKGP